MTDETAIRPSGPVFAPRGKRCWADVAHRPSQSATTPCQQNDRDVHDASNPKGRTSPAAIGCFPASGLVSQAASIVHRGVCSHDPGLPGLRLL
jgi:hypothetical protein